MNFDNFYVYEGNKVAYLAAQKIIEFPGELFNPLYVYGGTGIGKTHLLIALQGELNKKQEILFFAAKEFETYLHETKKFDAPIIVDDIHNVTPVFHETILTLIDSCLANNKQICFSGNAAPRELKNFDERLLSRFEGGLVCDIAAPKEMALIELIKKKSGESGVLLPENILLELAQLSGGSIRSIEGMIKRLVAYSSLGNVTLDSDSIKMILKEFYPKGIYSPVSSLLEELKKNASEVLRDVSEKLDKREEYREKIYVWEMKGFDTSTLKSFLDGDIEQLKTAYDDYIKKVERLVQLQKEFGTLNLKDYPDEVMRIESLLFSPERVTEIEAMINKVARRPEAPVPDLTFETYVLGPCNENAVRMYREQVVSNLGKAFNPYVIFGKCGTGKTRLLKAIEADLIARGKNVGLLDLAHRDNISLPSLDEYDVLLVDNFHEVMEMAETARQAIFEVLRGYMSHDKAVIMSAEPLRPEQPLSENEQSLLQLGIEVELGAPGNEVIDAYITARVGPEQASSVIAQRSSTYESFKALDDFIASVQGERPADEAVPTHEPVAVEAAADVVSLGLPGEEITERERPVEKEGKEEAEKVVVLGLPGEEQVGEPAGVHEGVVQSEGEKEIDSTDKSAQKAALSDITAPLKSVKEERFIIEYIPNEMIEDNY